MEKSREYVCMYVYFWPSLPPSGLSLHYVEVAGKNCLASCDIKFEVQELVFLICVALQLYDKA